MRANADVGVGVTGIAGPGGAAPGKPVGTVCVGVVTASGVSRVQTYQFPGERAAVKQQASQVALELVRRVIVNEA
jgi:nicotinamide mononucleotide (NMN) deamidase PncC